MLHVLEISLNTFIDIFLILVIKKAKKTKKQKNLSMNLRTYLQKEKNTCLVFKEEKHSEINELYWTNLSGYKYE